MESQERRRERERREVLEKVLLRCENLGSVGEVWKRDREVVAAAAQQQGAALGFADEALKGDREFVLALLHLRRGGLNWSSALQYATEALRADRKIVLAAVGQCAGALQYATEALRADREVVLSSLWERGGFQYASEALRADRELVLTAVQRNGFALRYAAEALRADREVVLAAVQNEGCSLEYASEALKADPNVVRAAAKLNGASTYLRFVADVLLEDPTFATEAKSEFHLLKLTMLSGRSTVVVAGPNDATCDVLDQCRERLGLADAGTTMELWCGSERVTPEDPEDEDLQVKVQDWPGIHPRGEISEYQLLFTR